MRKLYNPGRSNIVSQNGMAATSQPLSTLEAINILQNGGNAIDAAIAASAVQSVVEPGSTGIGGDCFAIISINGKDPISVNGSGISPLKANFEYFNNKNIKKIETTSPHSITIPGAVHAWHTMHKKFGKLDFEQLFITAENYARNGFPIHEVESISWKKNEQKLSLYPNTKKLFLNNGKSYKFGEIFKNIPLANSIKAIGKKGLKAFYSGDIAKDMVETLQSVGGLHTMEDFYNQQTIISKTIKSKFKDFYIHQCPPNGPGVTVLMMIKLLEKFNFNNIEPNSFERYHLQTEITKICYEEKENKLGDPNFSNININELLTDNFINMLFKKIDMNKVYNPLTSYITAHPDTVYLTVIDKDLNAISFINSICYAFGSGITSNKTGILFQNRGVNFRLEENHPNVVMGNKKPLHTIIPGLLTDLNNNTIFSFGVMGGQYQPIGQTHVLQNIYDFKMNVQEAIDFPRAFMINGNLKLEKNVPNNTFKALEKLGHNVIYEKDSIGGGQGILIDRSSGVLIGGSDPRKDGLALGY
tara:strand:- start:2950 stop:4536 length:1587 start_codon:yes stop_codon:yes gene_type:complete